MTRTDSINATTSASSNSTTRALILCRAILPSSAQRKIVRGQTPRRAAIVLALLNWWMTTQFWGAVLGESDVFMVTISGAIVPQPSVRVYRVYGSWFTSWGSMRGGDQSDSTRAASINASTSASSNSTTRALILWRVSIPPSAHRKIVRGHTPSFSAIALAFLNRRMDSPVAGAIPVVRDVDVFMGVISAFTGPRQARASTEFTGVAIPRLGQFSFLIFETTKLTYVRNRGRLSTENSVDESDYLLRFP